MKTQSQDPQSTGEWLLNTIKQNPEGLLLVAAGAVLMMRQKSSNVAFDSNSIRGGAINSRPESEPQPLNAVSDAVSEAYDRTQEFGRSIGEQSKQVLQNTNSAVGDTLQQVAETRPFAVALAGIATGAAVAAVFPVTQVEKRALAPAAERFTSQVKDVAVKASDKLTEVAKDRVTEGLKTVASEVAGTVGQSLGARDNR
jgi:hypothetical protein